MALLAVGAVVLVGVHSGIALLSGNGSSGASIEPEAAPVAAAPAALTPEQERERERRAQQDALLKQIEALQSGEALERETDAMQRVAAQEAAAQRAKAQKAAADRASAEAAAHEAERAARAARPEAPDPKALERARRRVGITMYSTTWCPACDKARAYMKARDIRYTEHDIDASARAKAECRRRNPKGSVPTIDIEGEVMVGFSSRRLENMIDTAAEKHLRL